MRQLCGVNVRPRCDHNAGLRMIIDAPLLLQPPRALKPRSLSIIIISRVVQPRPNFYLSVSLCSETKVSLMR